MSEGFKVFICMIVGMVFIVVVAIIYDFNVKKLEAEIQLNKQQICQNCGFLLKNKEKERDTKK